MDAEAVYGMAFSGLKGKSSFSLEKTSHCFMAGFYVLKLLL